jgi:hypothetical protein
MTMRKWIERKTHILWGVYRWHGGPILHLVIGASNKSNTVLEIGILGRTFWVAPEPR